MLDVNGKSAPETKYQRVLRGKESPPMAPLIESGVMGSLAPGETAKDAMIVNKFFDLSKPGTCAIQVTLSDPVSKATAKSNIIRVTVTAQASEHPCRLSSGIRCEDILK